MKKRYLECGKIVSVHGIRGEVKIQPWTDSPELLCELEVVYLQNGQRSMEILRAREHKNMVIVQFKGIDDANTAHELINQIVCLDREDIELEEGAYFIQDLIGIQVFDIDSGICYGTLCDVTETGANDVYHIKDETGKIRLIPNIKQVVIETDLDNQTMKIRPLEGLFDED